MRRPLSNDLRECVGSAVIAGESCRSAAARFDVTVSSVVKWAQRHRTTGSRTPGKLGADRKPVLGPHGDLLVQRIEAVPHLTLQRLKRGLAERGVKVSHNAIWTFMR
ncbi:MAG: transposase [Alphaproteobacteria bacterium]|nr:transposase [Alphaproteobacteria bacterium]